MYKKLLKRLLDIVFSLILLIILSPIFLLISFLVLIFIGYPIIFVQERPGKDEKIFKLYKFRTMTNKKDKNNKLLSDEKRLTVFGKALRRTSLDELPELYNILKGDMSFIGPRPLLIEYLSLYNETQKRRHEVRPGLTGLAQIRGRNNLKWEERFKLDVEYIDTISFKKDFYIFIHTILKVMSKKDIEQTGTATVEKFKGNNIVEEMTKN